jgi:hypothetical protein
MRRVLTFDKELGIKTEKQWRTTWGRHQNPWQQIGYNFGRTHGINLRNICEGHMGTIGIRYGTFGKEYEVKQGTN